MTKTKTKNPFADAAEEQRELEAWWNALDHDYEQEQKPRKLQKLRSPIHIDIARLKRKLGK